MPSWVMLKCDYCYFNAEAWSDGNPYYIDDLGEKQYAYHPSHKVALCTEVDTPYICMKCAHKFNVDSAAPIRCCPECNFGRICQIWRLIYKKCPKCKIGRIMYMGEMRKMQKGRAALAAEGRDDRGPYLDHLESGLEHFNAWLRREIGEG